MAGRLFQVTSDSISMGTTEKTVLQVRPPANLPIVFRSLVLTMLDQTTSNQPLLWVGQQTIASGGSAPAGQPVPEPPFFGTILSTFLEGDFSAEPTDERTFFGPHFLQAQTPFQFGRSQTIEQGKALGVKLWQPGAATGDFTITITCEE